MIVCKLFRIFCYISAWEVFWLFCRWGLWYASSSLHTHTLCISWAGPYTRVCELGVRGHCVAVPQWMNFPSGHC